ncbi:MAG: hypothetical protein ACF8R9_11415 [Phycisphaerales bacterium JB054]
MSLFGRMMAAVPASAVSETGNRSLTLQPEASAWAGLLRHPPAGATARTTRDALGLPTDRPVVMGGHQPGLWHPGILAKYLSIRACCARTGAAGAWVVVDQSPGAGASIAYPALADQSDSKTRRVSRETLLLGTADAPPAAQRATRPVAPSDGATAAVREGLSRLTQLLSAHAEASSLARQLHASCIDALAERDGSAEREPVRSCFATDLHRTPGFAELVGAMREDPASCARHYNEAAAAFPHSGVRALATAGNTVELPLWERTTTPERPGPWRTVMSDRLADLPDEALVLRGLPMTGLLRHHACDLFVHGTGGGASESGGSDAHEQAGYDRVTERWFEEWLGVTDLAPSVVATATLRLDFAELPGASDTPSPREIDAARAHAHRAAHDPALLGDDARGEAKRELAARISTLPRHSPQRRELYREMHELREAAVRAHADKLAALRDRAAALASRLNDAAIIDDRTWSFLFHDPSSLAGLRRDIEQAFAEAAG